MTLHPPGWRPNHHGDTLRRRVGQAAVRVFRRPGRGGWYIGLEIRADCTDVAEACALAEAVAGAFLEAHRAGRESAA